MNFIDSTTSIISTNSTTSIISTNSTTSTSSYLSIYIPIISESTSEEYIKKMFNSNKIGKIMRVDFVKNKNKNRREAFVHFHEWFDTDESKKLQEDILNPNSKTRFKYLNTNKYWPLLVNKNPDKKVVNPNYEIVKKEVIKNSLKEEFKLNSTGYKNCNTSNTCNTSKTSNKCIKKV